MYAGWWWWWWYVANKSNFFNNKKNFEEVIIKFTTLFIFMFFKKKKIFFRGNYKLKSFLSLKFQNSLKKVNVIFFKLNSKKINILNKLNLFFTDFHMPFCILFFEKNNRFVPYAISFNTPLYLCNISMNAISFNLTTHYKFFMR